MPFPRLSGQPFRYLYNALNDFAPGRREESVMAPIARSLTPEAMRDVAAFYAAQDVETHDMAAFAEKLADPRPGEGHHSVAFYSNELATVQGELVEIAWQNPHIKPAVRSAGPVDAGKLWHVESSSIFLRQQDGDTRDLFRVGDSVKVIGRRSPRDASALLGLNLLLPDACEALLWPSQPPRFAAADKLITRRAQVVDAARENRSIFRVWLPTFFGTNPYAGLPFRDTAVAARQSFDSLAFARSCEPEGMPRILISIFRYEFVDRDSEIFLRTELYDTERTIHVSRSAPPPGTMHSALGYSVGEWRDRHLVVTTTLVNWRYFDNIGTPQSDDVRIIERYTLSPDQGRLEVEITVVDEATFTAPAVLRTSWTAYAGNIRPYDCQAG